MGETDCGGNWVLFWWALLSKSLIQLSVDGQGCVPSLLFDLRSNYGGGNEDDGDLLQKVPCRHCYPNTSNPAAGYHHPTPLPETPGPSQANLGQSLVGVTAPFSWVVVHTKFCLCPPRVVCPSPTTRACSNSCLLNQWCHLTVSSSVICFSSCLQSRVSYHC